MISKGQIEHRSINPSKVLLYLLFPSLAICPRFYDRRVLYYFAILLIYQDADFGADVERRVMDLLEGSGRCGHLRGLLAHYYTVKLTN